MEETVNKKRLGDELPFLYSIWYLIALGVFVYLFWLFDLGVYGMTAMIVLAGVVFAFCKDLTPLIPLSFYFVQTVSDTLNAVYSFIWYICALTILIAGIVIHFIRFKPYKNYGKLKGFPVAVAFCGIAIALGGITVISERSVIPALVATFYGIVAAGSGFFFYATLGQKDPKRLINITMWSILASSAVAIVQLITLIFMSGDPVGAISSKYQLNAGYGHPNYLANIISRSVPICIYLSVGNKKHSVLWLIGALMCGICILLTSSRATLLVALPLSVICLIYFFPKSEYKLNWICTLFMLIGLTMIGLAVIGNGRLEKLFATLVKVKLDSNGRLDLWKLGIERFKNHPVFGVGLDYDIGGRVDKNPTNTPFTPFWYHSTIVQILCSLGIFGLIAYVFYFYRQYRLFAINKRPDVKALMFVIITIQVISLADTFFLTPQEFLQMVLITTVALRTLPEDKLEKENSHIYDLISLGKNLKGKTKKEKN